MEILIFFRETQVFPKVRCLPILEPKPRKHTQYLPCGKVIIFFTSTKISKIHAFLIPSEQVAWNYVK